MYNSLVTHRPVIYVVEKPQISLEWHREGSVSFVIKSVINDEILQHL
jgi:hypothetical protein